MAITNSWFFTKTVINWDKFAQATHNMYKVVSVRPYVDKKGVLPEGFTITLMIIKDEFDYGINKNGQTRENNLYQNFDATVLCIKNPVKKGDTVRLLDFDEEHSFSIGFDMILRFKDYEVLSNQSTKPN